MKIYLIAASALLLGTSAQAWTPDGKAVSGKSPVLSAAAVQMKAAVLDVLDQAKLESNARLAAAESYQGMGGPIAETGYPPCAPGPGDDRCIQLYEPGVTGAGN